jgi:hypothetical protein
LLALYRRTLAFTIKRTDPPPGTAADFPPARIAATFESLPASLADGADARFVAAATALPCVTVPALGGVTARLDVVLEPRARYDVRLVAAPVSDPDATEMLVSVTNFIASRYASPRALLDALGLLDAAASPVLPHDAVVDDAVRRGALVLGDAALDATLVSLGLDPWPLATRPRVVALWRGAPNWTFEGLLIEADEAIVRPGRLAVATITVDGRPLTVVRQSSSGARVLAAPASSLHLAAESVIDVALTSSPLGADGQPVHETIRGTRRILNRPRMDYQEVP